MQLECKYASISVTSQSGCTSRKVQQLNSWGGGYVVVIIISNYVMLSSASHNSVLLVLSSYTFSHFPQIEPSFRWNTWLARFCALSDFILQYSYLTL